jgi:hypothetical protein
MRQMPLVRRILIAERRYRRKRGQQQHARNARGLDSSSASIEAVAIELLGRKERQADR